jgi:hypothetical protein
LKAAVTVAGSMAPSRQTKDQRTDDYFRAPDRRAAFHAGIPQPEARLHGSGLAPLQRSHLEDKSMKAFRACLVAMCLACAAPASAETITFSIGQFSWDDYGDGLGPVFTVINFLSPFAIPPDSVPAEFTGEAFDDVMLTLDGVTAPYESLDPGAILSAFGDPGVASATLAFTFLYSFAGSPGSQPYVVTLDQPALELIPIFDEQGEIVGGTEERHAAGLIDFELTTGPTPVPEPGSLTFLVTALAFAAARAARQRRT